MLKKPKKKVRIQENLKRKVDQTLSSQTRWNLVSLKVVDLALKRNIDDPKPRIAPLKEVMMLMN
jgi:hypothetical protein